MERRLKTLEDVRRYLAYLIREIEADRVDPQKGGRLAFIASVLLKAIQGGELERKIEEIERALEKGGPR
jgi:hypothetical protein